MVKGGMHGEGGVHDKGGLQGEGVCIMKGACITKGGMHGKGGHVWQSAVCGRRGSHCSRRYASYLNAFLLHFLVC